VRKRDTGKARKQGEVERERAEGRKRKEATEEVGKEER